MSSAKKQGGHNLSRSVDYKLIVFDLIYLLSPTNIIVISYAMQMVNNCDYNLFNCYHIYIYQENGKEQTSSTITIH